MLELSKQIAVPFVVCNPFTIILESASVSKVMSLLPYGVKLVAPYAVKLLPAVRLPDTVAEPLKVVSPVPRKV